MFAQATPAAEDLVDGCTVVVLDDFSKDWRELLGLIYPLSTNVNFNGRKVDIAFISAIIRLGYKYGMKELYDQAMGYLTAYYTTSFDAWADGRNAARWQPDPIHAITAINLARLTNTAAILPAAFYICATLGSGDVARGVPLEDGSTEQLTLEDMRLVCQLAAHLVATNTTTSFALFNAPGGQRVWPRKGCCAEVWCKLLWYTGDSSAPHPVSSKRALDSWMENADSLQAAGPARGLGVMLLQHVYGLGWLFDPPRALCEGCRDHLQRRDRELRKEVWGELPKLLGLKIDGWDAT